MTKTSLPCIVAGDLNCGQIDWASLTAPSDGVQDVILKFVVSNGFAQSVREPTRGENILDIVLCNEPLSVFDTAVLPPFGCSDHSQVEFSTFAHISQTETVDDRTTPIRLAYDWANADCDGINQYLCSINWYNLLTTNLTADALWQSFKDILQDAIDLNVPARLVHKVPKAKVWYPSCIKRAVARKRRCWRKHKTNPHDSAASTAYQAAADRHKKLIFKYELKREQKIIDCNNIGAFYKFINRKLSNKQGVGALHDQDGNIVTGDIERANLLNNFFASICVDDDGSKPTIERIMPENASIDTIDFTPIKIASAMKKMQAKKSPGPDGFPPCLYKRLIPGLAEPLSLIFTSFMSTGSMPSEWRHATVIPIFKKGNAADLSNYRPISLTSAACKIMERVIYADIVAYLRLHNAISKQQHAFLSRRSTCTNLIETINDWTLAIKNKKTVAVAYIDYSRAFDTVSHKKLLTKLQAYGIQGNLLAWIESFLTGRSQQTRVGDVLSQVAYLHSGVVQGSVLGPLLFLLYINDVVEAFRDSKCTCKLYADDLKIYTEIQLVDDLNLLQSALDALYEWSDRWQLSISYKKCSAILINAREQTEELINANPLSVGPNYIATNGEIKDLGITIDSNLGFSSHINNIVARAHARSCLIYKCFISKDTTTLLRAFTTYVRPLLEYATCIWSPQHVTVVRQVESVQRRFTKRLPGLKHLSYDDRLAGAAPGMG